MGQFWWLEIFEFSRQKAVKISTLILMLNFKLKVKIQTEKKK